MIADEYARYELLPDIPYNIMEYLIYIINNILILFYANTLINISKTAFLDNCLLSSYIL